VKAADDYYSNISNIHNTSCTDTEFAWSSTQDLHWADNTYASMSERINGSLTAGSPHVLGPLHGGTEYGPLTRSISDQNVTSFSATQPYTIVIMQDWLIGLTFLTSRTIITAVCDQGVWTNITIQNYPDIDTDLTAKTVEETVVPGCDVLIAVPSTAVSGMFVADATVYWEPGKLTSPLVTIPAGNTYLIAGQDVTGQFRKVLLACQWLWVETNTVGPNPQAPWNGSPLPTAVVE
jgi:hypothetical protein